MTVVRSAPQYRRLRAPQEVLGIPDVAGIGAVKDDDRPVFSGPINQLLELVKAHIDLINVVIQGKMKGDGGKVGADLLTSLDPDHPDLKPLADFHSIPYHYLPVDENNRPVKKPLSWASSKRRVSSW